MKKNFSKIEIAVIKRTAQNVAQFITKKSKIDAQIAELEAEKASLQPIIDSFQGPIKEMTGGYTTEDLINCETVHTGKINEKTGKEILQTRFVLKYPETVIPVENEEPVAEVKQEDSKEESVMAEPPVQEEDATMPPVADEFPPQDENDDPFFQN